MIDEHSGKALSARIVLSFLQKLFFLKFAAHLTLNPSPNEREARQWDLYLALCR